jgi:hypothetical protein
MFALCAATVLIKGGGSGMSSGKGDRGKARENTNVYTEVELSDGEPPFWGEDWFSQLVHSVRPVAMEVAERRKPDWPLHSEAVRRTLRVSQKSKKEIPNYTNRNLE